jgi:hypothetical protein
MAEALRAQKKFTDQVDVQRAMALATTVGWATVGASVLSLVLAPNAVVLAGGIAVAGWMTTRAARARALAEQQAIGQLGAKRTYIYKADGSDLPMAKVTSKTAWWTPNGVCFEMVRDREAIRPRGAPTHHEPWYRHRVLPHLLARYQGQEAWLQTHHRDRWNLCRAWWLRGYVVPALQRRWPGHVFELREPETQDRKTVETQLEFAPTNEPPQMSTWTVVYRTDDVDGPMQEAPREWIGEVVADYQYFRYLAIRLALTPAFWSRRLDQRPSKRAIGFLASSFMDLVKDVVPPPPTLPENLVVRFPVADEVCVGRGVEWDLRHAKALMEQMSFDRDSIGSENPDDGDPRIFGVAAHEAEPVFFPEAWFSQHALVSGTTGTGKTCASESVVTTAVRSGLPLIFVDPKGSRSALNRIFYEARKFGRGEQVNFFHFSEAKNPEVASYNPLYDYDDPSELASRIASVVARSTDPTWFYSALGTAKSVVSLAHYTLEYLRIVGSQKVPLASGGYTTQLHPRYSRVPPKICLALALRAELPTLTPADAEVLIDAALENRRNPLWNPQTDGERILYRMLKDEAGLWFCPAVWSPSMRPVNTWGVGSPEVLVGHAMHVVYQHLWATYINEDHPEAQDIPGLGNAKRGKDKSPGEEGGGDFPTGWGLPLDRKRHARLQRISRTGERYEVECYSLANTLGVRPPAETPAESILGRDPFSAHSKPKNERASWKRMVGRFQSHPATERDNATAPDPDIIAYFNHFVSLDAHMHERLRVVMKMFIESLETMWIKAVEDRREHQKHQLTLSTSLSKFEGERERIISNVDPDINLRQVVADRAITVFYMNYMKDPEAVEGMARVIICDALGYLGAVSGTAAKGRYDWYLVCDECAVFLNNYITPIVAQGRSVGVRTILIMQNRVDLDVSMASADKAAQTLGNLSVKMQLRTETQADAKAFSEKAGEVTIPVDTGLNRSFTPGYGKTGLQTIEAFSVNESRNVAMQKVPLVDPNALMKLPKGHYFANAFGRTWLLVQGLLPDAPDTNILEEYDMLRYDASLGEKRPAIVDRRKSEIAATNTALANAMPRTQARPDSNPENEALPAIREGGGGVMVASSDSKESKDKSGSGVRGTHVGRNVDALNRESVDGMTKVPSSDRTEMRPNGATDSVRPASKPDEDNPDDLQFTA